MGDVNLCLTCGACCAFFRASFYWAETDQAPGGTVPEELTEQVNDFKVCMKGTNKRNPRCVALEGEIGKNVACSIYPKRSSVCRGFVMATDSDPEHGCNKARKLWGLPPIIWHPQTEEGAIGMSGDPSTMPWVESFLKDANHSQRGQC